MPIAIVRKIRVVEQPPQLILANAWSQNFLELRNAVFSYGNRPLDRGNFIGRLYYSCVLGDSDAVCSWLE